MPNVKRSHPQMTTSTGWLPLVGWSEALCNVEVQWALKQTIAAREFYDCGKVSKADEVNCQ